MEVLEASGVGGGGDVEGFGLPDCFAVQFVRLSPFGRFVVRKKCQTDYSFCGGSGNGLVLSGIFCGCRRTPTAFRHPAQGWRDNGAPTLGHWLKIAKTLKGFRPPACLGVKAATHSGLLFIVNRIPRVARASQPWADGRNAVGVLR